MSQGQRTLFALALSILVFVVWYGWISPPPSSEKPGASVMKGEPGEADSSEETSKTLRPDKGIGIEKGVEIQDQKVPEVPEKTQRIETELYRILFSSWGGEASSWELKKYRKGENGWEAPTQLLFAGAKGLRLKFERANFQFPEVPSFNILRATKEEVEFGWESGEARLIKRFRFRPDSYVGEVEVELFNKSREVLSAEPEVSWEGVVGRKESGFLSFLKGPPDQWQPIFWADGKVVRHANIEGSGETTLSGKVYWGGAESRYFLASVIPQGLATHGALTVREEALGQTGRGTRVFRSSIAQQTFHLTPGETWKGSWQIYVGPKQREALKAFGVRLEDALDYGWFGIFAVPILYLLKLFYNGIPNYGVAIIGLTLLIKLLFHPINRKSMEQMKAMQGLQPKLAELRKKHANDKERLNMETMNLFRTHKVNPMGGCLPMLLQLPIYIALYRVLWNSVELYRAPFFWFYRDLSVPDPYFITPILLGLAMVWQARVSPAPSADPMQQKMMMLMPLMFAGFMIFLPMGLTLYILVNTLLTIGSQWLYKRGIRLRDLIRGRIPVPAK